MTRLHQTQVDGIQCFWVESGRPTVVASLLFRQGTADEQFHESGWLHLLEHLALHGRGGGRLHVNGSVSPLVTSLDCHGPAGAVTEHLAATCAWLSDPFLDELERERGVLRAETGLRENPAIRALTWRFGARGPGLSGLEEPGLGRATPERLRERTQRVFNRSNAVLVLDGPPPTGLSLSLPEGDFLPPQQAEPCSDLLPAAYLETRGLVLSGLVERSIAATFLPAVLQHALTDRFRHQVGVAYAPWSHYEAVDGSHAVVISGSDLNPEALPSVARTTLDLVSRLRRNGPDPTQLADHREATVQALSDPYRVGALALRAAHGWFEGRAPQDLDEVLDEARSLDVDEVAGPLEAFCSSLLLGLPHGAAWYDELPGLRQPTARPGPGRRFRHRNWPASGARLTISDDRVQVGAGDSVATIELAHVAGMYVYDDGSRRLLCRDAWSIGVDPTEWHDGGAAVSLLDRLVPEERHLPHPTPEAAPTTTRLSWRRRWWIGFSNFGKTPHTALWMLGGLLVMAALLAGLTRTAYALLLFFVTGFAVLVQLARMLPHATVKKDDPDGDRS